ncbi:MAG TPA: efflux RND transporter permease subunit [Allosphingosinicella sp.]|nr:efflux RND transporter permease subunit [Allosphingosinicella sp.]
MIARLIGWSIRRRLLVIGASLALALAGLWALQSTAVDALPDLSDVQVILRTTYSGQAPQIVENQVTYPIETTMMSVPGARTVRGYSFFGDSFVYIIFEDGTDPYWARSRVLEYLNQIQSQLPQGAQASLGPDATGVGWIFEYALVDRTGRHDLGQLRALQDWFLRYELKTVPNVAEVASIGGMVRQYQIVLDPLRMRALGVTQNAVIDAVRSANNEAGGSVVEMGEAEYMVRASGYLRTLDDFRTIPIRTTAAGVSVTLADVAFVQLGPEIRRGIAELNGEGEVAGGVVLLRSGKDARATIAAVQARLDSLRASLPPGVEIVTTYDRSALIDRAVGTLESRLLEEFLVVALVCILFLFHMRSALVAIVTLPLGILAAFLVMRLHGLNANIMSLGGIAIAIGAMVDAAVVMIENAHKHLEHWRPAEGEGRAAVAAERWRVIGAAAAEVGPSLFFSLLIITVSFVPIFTLQAQEGRLFAPLAFTKTYAMAASAILSVTLVPVLMGYLIRGRIPLESANPLSRALIRLYRPALRAALRRPRATLALAGLALLITLWPASRLGGEFLPPLNEGDILYMPTAQPGLSAEKASQLLQATDAMIRQVPEVESVFGKAGRAETATDPAPLEMFETVVRLKPRDQWRPGMTMDRLLAELDRRVRVPGLANVWVPPIRNRIDMLATGIKTPVGVKVSGPDIGVIDRIAHQVEQAAIGVPGVTSAVAERLTGGRYIQVDIDRRAAARFGMSIADVQSIIASAVGGENVGRTVEGVARFPINVRYPREVRDSLEALRALPILTERGAQLTLGDVASIAIQDGPPMLRTENARPSGWVYVDVHGRDLSSVVGDLQRAVARDVRLPPGYTIGWSGQFEYLQRAAERLRLVVPLTLALIFLLLFLNFRSVRDAGLIMASLPFALVGGFWLIYLLGHAVSVASAVGFIALAGVAAEFGVVMLLYLDRAWEARRRVGHIAVVDLDEAIEEGAVMRVRPKAMTVAVIIAGLIPIMIGGGAGSEIMQRIAAPMIGGMLTAPLLSLFVIPVIFRLVHARSLGNARDTLRDIP